MDEVSKSIQYVNGKVQNIVKQDKNIILFIICSIVLLSIFANFIPIGLGEFFENPIIMFVYLLTCLYLWRFSSILSVFLIVFYLTILIFTNKSRIEELYYKSVFFKKTNKNELEVKANTLENYIRDQLSKLKDQLMLNKSVTETMINGNNTQIKEQLQKLYDTVKQIPISQNPSTNQQIQELQQQIIAQQEQLQQPAQEYQGQLLEQQRKQKIHKDFDLQKASQHMPSNLFSNENSLDEHYKIMFKEDDSSLPVNTTSVQKLLTPCGNTENQMDAQGLNGLPGLGVVNFNGAPFH